jgi:hypothetical protein
MTIHTHSLTHSLTHSIITTTTTTSCTQYCSPHQKITNCQIDYGLHLAIPTSSSCYTPSRVPVKVGVNQRSVNRYNIRTKSDEYVGVRGTHTKDSLFITDMCIYYIIILLLTLI